MRKIMVCGGRDFEDSDTLFSVLDGLQYILPIDIDEMLIIHGGARGADLLGKEYAEHRGMAHSAFPADWKRYGKSAGYRRNVDMVKEADAVVAFWDGESKGTKHSIDLALDRGLPLLVIRYYTGGTL